MIKCLLTEWGRAGRENIWLSVRMHGPSVARFVRPDLEPNIFPSGPPTQSISTYYLISDTHGTWGDCQNCHNIMARKQRRRNVKVFKHTETKLQADFRTVYENCKVFISHLRNLTTLSDNNKSCFNADQFLFFSMGNPVTCAGDICGCQELTIY